MGLTLMYYRLVGYKNSIASLICATRGNRTSFFSPPLSRKLLDFVLWFLGCGYCVTYLQLASTSMSNNYSDYNNMIYNVKKPHTRSYTILS